MPTNPDIPNQAKSSKGACIEKKSLKENTKSPIITKKIGLSYKRKYWRKYSEKDKESPVKMHQLNVKEMIIKLNNTERNGRTEKHTLIEAPSQVIKNGSKRDKKVESNEVVDEFTSKIDSSLESMSKIKCLTYVKNSEKIGLNETKVVPKIGLSLGSDTPKNTTSFMSLKSQNNSRCRTNKTRSSFDDIGKSVVRQPNLLTKTLPTKESTEKSFGKTLNSRTPREKGGSNRVRTIRNLFEKKDFADDVQGKRKFVDVQNENDEKKMRLEHRL